MKVNGRQTGLLLGVLVTASSLWATESTRTFVFLHPETSSFWRTAKGNEMTLPIDFPDGATSATLSVRGSGYQASYDITEGTSLFELTLPSPTAPAAENIYDLTLAFDNNVTNAARIALIQGLTTTAAGGTRCLAPDTTRSWKKVRGRAVFPIPYGTTSFTINGQETETGLDGAQGWYMMDGLSFGHDADLTLETTNGTYAASLIGGPGGVAVIVR